MEFVSKEPVNIEEVVQATAKATAEVVAREIEEKELEHKFYP